MISIGVIDTMGLVATVEALDVCLKTAEVRLVSCEQVKGGIVSFTITGDVAAVKSAVDAGVAAAERLGGYLNHTVIARIDEQTDGLLEAERKQAPSTKPAPEATALGAVQPSALAEKKPAGSLAAVKPATSKEIKPVEENKAQAVKATEENKAPAAKAAEASKTQAAKPAEVCTPVDTKVDVVAEPESKPADTSDAQAPAAVTPKTKAAPKTASKPKAQTKPKAKPKAKAKTKPKTTAKKAPKKPDAKA